MNFRYKISKNRSWRNKTKKEKKVECINNQKIYDTATEKKKIIINSRAMVKTWEVDVFEIYA